MRSTKMDKARKRQVYARLGRSIAFRLLVVGMVLYAIYHAVAALSPRLLTDLVVSGEQTTTLSGQAVIFRDETVVTATGGRYLCSYPLENGAKVNSQSTLCQLYATSLSEDELQVAQSTLVALDRQIALAERMPSHDTLSVLNSLRESARDQVIANNQKATDGAPMSAISDGAFSLLLSLHRIDALTGQSGGGQDVLAALRGERTRLLMSTGYSSRTLTVADANAPSTSGYFYYADRVDGYEALFARSALSSLTLSELDALLENGPQIAGPGVSVVGKLAASQRWSAVVSVDPELARDLKIGQRYTLTWPDEYDKTFSMTLSRVIGSVADGHAYAVFDTSELPNDFSFPRFSRVTLTLSSVQGYRVPEDALCESGGRTGVYILKGGRVSFRAAEVLARADGYVIVYAPSAEQRRDEQDTTYHADRYLALQDVVIVEGKDLYDGKYIR